MSYLVLLLDSKSPIHYGMRLQMRHIMMRWLHSPGRLWRLPCVTVPLVGAESPERQHRVCILSSAEIVAHAAPLHTDMNFIFHLSNSGSWILITVLDLATLNFKLPSEVTHVPCAYVKLFTNGQVHDSITTFNWISSYHSRIAFNAFWRGTWGRKIREPKNLYIPNTDSHFWIHVSSDSL